MELHSYAKRRTLKKWTIEQKRKLVEARIVHDAWFTNKPTSLVPWKNILIAANLDDFNVFFVRKQWSNMLARYKQYKQTRMGSNIASKAIDAELIKRINQEWEFFEPIHKFMTRKTTNLHSYALSHRTENNNGGEKHENGEELMQAANNKEQELCRQINKTPTKLLHNETITINLSKDCVKENIPNNNTIVLQSNNVPEDDGIHLFSSDTNEEFQVIADTARKINASKERPSGEHEEDENMNFVRNTDHDFYSKRSSLGRPEQDESQEIQSNYFADASEESQGSLNMVVNFLQANKTTNDSKSPDVEIKIENISYSENNDLKEEINDNEFLDDMPSTSTQKNLTHTVAGPQTSSKPRLSERDKYYRHKRRFNRRLEKRFDAILQVVGQIVKAEYPRVDISPMVGTVTSMASSMGKILSSDSEDNN